MLPEALKEKLTREIAAAEHPRELVVDVLFALQAHYGYLSDEAVAAAGELLQMSPLQIEELATFYTFLYREPVGRYVIHLCDSLVCWLEDGRQLMEHLCRRLGIRMGETTEDGMLSLIHI